MVGALTSARPCAVGLAAAHVPGTLVAVLNHPLHSRPAPSSPTLRTLPTVACANPPTGKPLNSNGWDTKACKDMHSGATCTATCASGFGPKGALPPPSASSPAGALSLAPVSRVSTPPTKGGEWPEDAERAPGHLCSALSAQRAASCNAGTPLACPAPCSLASYTLTTCPGSQKSSSSQPWGAQSTWSLHRTAVAVHRLGPQLNVPDSA